MGLVLADRVKETTTTTGTGTVTLAGAATGYQSFAAIGNGNTTYYTIAGQTGSEWEVGIGTYTSAGTTLSRDTVLASSNAGSLVSFSAGTKDVWCDYPAGRAVVNTSGATINANSGSTLTLTAASNQVQIVKPTSPTNAVVTLPSALTMPAGDSLFIIYNQSPVGSNITINNASSSVVGYVAAGQVAILSLSDNSTSAGSWACTTSTVQAFTTPNTASYTTTTLTGVTNNLVAAVGLTSTTFVEAWAYSGGIYYRAATISGSTITYGTTTNFADPNSGTPQFIALFRISNTAFGLAWGWGSATSSYDPCVGTFYSASSYQYVRAGTVSGTTVTLGGTITQISQSEGGIGTTTPRYPNAPQGMYCPIDSTRFAWVYNNGFNSTINTQPYSGSLACVVYSLSGTTLTAGTSVALGTSSNSLPTGICALSSTLLLVVYGQCSAGNSTTGRTKAVTVSLSGTTVTWNSPTTVESADLAGVVNRNGNPKWNYAMANSATQAIANTAYGIIALSVSGTTVTVDANRTGGAPGSLYYVASNKLFSGDLNVYYNMATGGYYPSATATPIIQTTNAYTTATVLGQLGSVSPVTASSSFVGYTGSAVTTTRILISTN